MHVAACLQEQLSRNSRRLSVPLQLLSLALLLATVPSSPSASTPPRILSLSVLLLSIVSEQGCRPGCACVRRCADRFTGSVLSPAGPTHCARSLALSGITAPRVCHVQMAEFVANAGVGAAGFLQVTAPLALAALAGEALFVANTRDAMIRMERIRMGGAIPLQRRATGYTAAGYNPVIAICEDISTTTEQKAGELHRLERAAAAVIVEARQKAKGVKRAAFSVKDKRNKAKAKKAKRCKGDKGSPHVKKQDGSSSPSPPPLIKIAVAAKALRKA